jgi:hypothetical protein
LRAGGGEMDTQEIGDPRIVEVAFSDADHRVAADR